MDKKTTYLKIVKTLKSIFETNPILSFQAKMSLSATIMYLEFPRWIFCGFYVVKKSENILEIGPYRSNIIPCTQIKLGRGVCGESAKLGKSIVVNDVSIHKNYISCDQKTKIFLQVKLKLKF